MVCKLPINGFGICILTGEIDFHVVCEFADRAKNWLFIGREDAGEKSAIFYTLVENCRLGINPRDYFENVLTRLPAMKASEAASLTPANWHAARSGTPQRQAA